MQPALSATGPFGSSTDQELGTAEMPALKEVQENRTIDTGQAGAHRQPHVICVAISAGSALRDLVAKTSIPRVGSR